MVKLATETAYAKFFGVNSAYVTCTPKAIATATKLRRLTTDEVALDVAVLATPTMASTVFDKATTLASSSSAAGKDELAALLNEEYKTVPGVTQPDSLKISTVTQPSLLVSTPPPYGSLNFGKSVDNSNGSTSNGDVPLGAIIGGVVGAVLVVAVALVVLRKQYFSSSTGLKRKISIPDVVSEHANPGFVKTGSTTEIVNEEASSGRRQSAI